MAEVNLRANVRKESLIRRNRERHARKGGLTASYLEPDRDLDLEEDLGAIKTSIKSRAFKGGYESEGGSSDEERQRLLQAKRDDGGTRRGGCGLVLVGCAFSIMVCFNVCRCNCQSEENQAAYQ